MCAHCSSRLRLLCNLNVNGEESVPNCDAVSRVIYLMMTCVTATISTIVWQQVFDLHPMLKLSGKVLPKQVTWETHLEQFTYITRRIVLCKYWTRTSRSTILRIKKRTFFTIFEHHRLRQCDNACAAKRKVTGQNKPQGESARLLRFSVIREQ